MQVKHPFPTHLAQKTFINKDLYVLYAKVKDGDGWTVMI